MTLRSLTPENSENMINSFSSLDWGVVGGIGYGFPFGLSMDLRYHYSIAKALNEDALGPPLPLRIIDFRAFLSLSRTISSNKYLSLRVCRMIKPFLALFHV